MMPAGEVSSTTRADVARAVMLDIRLSDVVVRRERELPWWRRDRRREFGLRRRCEQHTIRMRCYCVRNLYATIRATMLAKISSAERDFRIIGLV